MTKTQGDANGRIILGVGEGAKHFDMGENTFDEGEEGEETYASPEAVMRFYGRQGT
jgi:hypothetical protein